MNIKNVAIGSAVVLSCAVSALAFSLSATPVSHADAVVSDTPSAQPYTTPTVTREAVTASAPVPTPAVDTPTVADPGVVTDSGSAPTPASTPLVCPPWTSPGVLGADGRANSCLWNMPESGGKIVLPPCAQEDSLNCYWDASKRGNGLGKSFININGTYFYAE